MKHRHEKPCLGLHTVLAVFLALFLALIYPLTDAGGVQARVSPSSELMLTASSPQLMASANSAQIRLAQKKAAGLMLQTLPSLQANREYVAQEVLISVTNRQDAVSFAQACRGSLISFSSHGVAVIRLPADRSVLETVRMGADLSNDLPAVYPNLIYQISETAVPKVPNDQQIIRQGYHYVIGSLQAWPTTTGDRQTVVAIIDTGIDTDHADLVEKILPQSYDAHNDRQGIIYVEDNQGHGTHVAGIIAADQGNDAFGSGIAPEASLLIIKANSATSPNTFTTASLIRAIYYAADHGADIINMSLGRPFSSGTDNLEKQAVDYAVSKGVMLVAAAGNESQSSVCYPAAYNDVICVSATAQNGVFASYSNYGAVDVCAPGTDIFSTMRDDQFDTLSGTSMAAPMVSAALALLKSAFPDETAQQLTQRLLTTARDLGSPGYDYHYGNGMIDIDAALDLPDSRFVYLGEGSADSPFLISTTDQLLYFAMTLSAELPDMLSAHYRLTEDVDLAGRPLWYQNRRNVEFSGVFDGDGHAVRNLLIEQPIDYNNNLNIGFIGRNSGTIQNLNLEVAMIDTRAIRSTDSVGGVCGYNKGLISNCRFDGEILGIDHLGGICGTSSMTISDCFNTGTIQGRQLIGGICGRSSAGHITSCTNLGTVTGTESDIGGLVGQAGGGLISAGLNNGRVSGDDDVGGIVGGGYVSVESSLNLGSVSGRKNIGGIAGVSSNAISDSANRGDISCSETNGGGIAGLSTNLLKRVYNVGLIDGSALKIGGICGDASSSQGLINCFDLEDTVSPVGTGQPGPISCSLEQLQHEEIYIGFDFADTWILPQPVESAGLSELPWLKAVYQPDFLFSLSNIVVKINGRANIIATDPQVAACAVFSFSSQNPLVAIVDSNGRVTGLAAGTTEIQVLRRLDGTTWKVRVDVEPPLIVLELTDTLTLAAGTVSAMTAVMEPKGTVDHALVWTSTDPAVASVDADGRIKTLRPGQTLISVSATDGTGLTDTCRVFVTRDLLDVCLISPVTTIKIFNSIRVTTLVSPIDYNTGNISYIISDPSIIRMDASGLVTGLRVGQSQITATTTSGRSSVVSFTVIQPVHSISITQDKVDLLVSQQAHLTAQISPANATNTAIMWQSDNSTVASVDENGLVTALQPGSAVISVTSLDSGATANCSVTVKIGINEIQINGPAEVNLKNTAQYVAEILPLDAADQTVAWSVIAESGQATIDANGWFKPVAAGSVYVKATAADGSLVSDVTKVQIIDTSKTVTFNSLGGTVVTSQKPENGEMLTMPANPTRSGYTFVGWYKDAICTAPWNFSAERVTDDLTLYARWLKTPVTGLGAVSSGFSSIRLTWTAASGADGYEIWRATSSNSLYNLAAALTGGSTTSYSNTSLTTNATYSYKIRAYAVIGGSQVYSSYSTAVSAKPVLSVPGSFTATTTGYSSIKLAWTTVAGASGYEIERKLWSTGTYAVVADTTGTLLDQTGLAMNKAYYYRIRAYRLVGTARVYSAYSSQVSVIPIPGTPTGISVVSSSYSSAIVTWKPVTGASGYEVYRKLWSTGTYALVGTVGETEFHNKSLATNKTYYYKVRAFRMSGLTRVYGLDSAQVSVTPVPSAPTGLKVVTGGSKTANVTWTAVSGASGYEVWRKMWSTGTYAIVSTQTATSLTNTGLAVSKTYYYKVRAYRMVGATKVYGPDSVVATYTPLS